MRIRVRAALALLLVTSPLYADEACPTVADAWTLARCAVSQSEPVRRARHELAAARGRRLTAEQLLPANPTVDVSVGSRRKSAGVSDVDRGIEVAQAFDVAGQRGWRIAVADAEVAAAVANLEAVERQLTVDVLAAAVEVRRAELAARLARDQRGLAERLVDISSARARDGVGPGLDVELAAAARIQALREELFAMRARSNAAVRLALVVGADVALAEDDAPIALAEPHAPVEEIVRQAIERRQIVRASAAQAETGRRRVDLLRRERIPSVTLGAHYRHEEWSEIAGGRLSVPLPIFRRNRGEIAEQEAMVAQAETAAAQARLKVALEVRATFAAWERARALLQGMPADLAARLEADAPALREAYERGTLPLPSALASLREVWNARRTVAEARAEATLAALDLITASAAQVTPAGEGRP